MKRFDQEQGKEGTSHPLNSIANVLITEFYREVQVDLKEFWLLRRRSFLVRDLTRPLHHDSDDLGFSGMVDSPALGQVTQKLTSGRSCRLGTDGAASEITHQIDPISFWRCSTTKPLTGLKGAVSNVYLMCHIDIPAYLQPCLLLTVAALLYSDAADYRV